MRTRIRATIALLVASVIASSVDFEAILHAHDDWILELRAHALAEAEGSRPCDRSPHWDRFRSELHGVCVACLVSAGAAARPGLAAGVPAPPRLEIPRPGIEHRLPASRRATPRRGRSPPLPLLRAA